MKRWCALGAFVALGGLCFAEEPLRLNDLVRAALANNPEILAARRRYEAARRRPSQASSLPDPMVSTGYASSGGPLPGQGLGKSAVANIGVMVSQEIPSAGKRRLRGEMAEQEAAAEYQEYVAAQLRVRERVEEAYHRLHHAYAVLEILGQGKDLLTRVIRVTEARYAAGKAAQQDILKAETQLSILEARVAEQEQARTTEEAEINALLNRRPGMAVGEPEDVESPPLAETADELLAKAAHTYPALLRGREMIERGRLAVDLAHKDFHSDATVSAGYFNMGGMAPMFQVRVDLPIHLHMAEVQKAALEEQVERMSAARRDLEAANQDLQFRVREAYAAAQTAYRLKKLYADTILPQSAMTIESSMASYETGGTDFLSVLTNVLTKIDAEERYHEQEMMYEVELARLEELKGGGGGGGMRLIRFFGGLLGVGLIFVFGFGYGRWYSTRPAAKAGRKILYYVDPMHPWYKADKPGIAPDCGMKLEAVYADGGATTAPPAAAAAGQEARPTEISISPEKQQLIGMRFGSAEWTTDGQAVRYSGRVVADETRVTRVHSKVDGWIDSVAVDFTGQLIKQGQPLLTLYSPELLASQQELLLAMKASHLMQHSSMVEAVANSVSLVDAARRRLELWDLGPAQIAEVERTGRPLKSITLYAPAGGFVTARNAFPGQRVTPETELYAVTDLSRVWVMADVFEADAPQVRVGQATTIFVPGTNAALRAKVSYLQPEVDPTTRTMKARIEVENPGFRLRPEMWVDVGMEIGGARRLTVPAEAVLDSGTEQTVFLDLGNGFFEPRKVQTGARVGDRVEIVKGLQPGERIVTSAAFLLDSESQLRDTK